MPKFKFEEIEADVTRGRLYPVYLIYGSEQYLIRLLVDKIKEVYKAETGTEAELFMSKGLDAVSVIDSLNTLPMWAKGRLVIIDSASGLSAKSKEQFAEYFNSVNSSAILVFTSEDFDGRSAFYKDVSKTGAVVKIDAVYENRVPFWINRECRLKGYNISHDAALFMTELVGTNLSSMADAVEKIILYVGDKKTIDVKDVETVLSDTSQKSIFDLTNAVGSKNISLASARLANLLKNNEAPVVIVNMLARHWRLLLQAKEAQETGRAGKDELARILNILPFFVDEYMSQAKIHSKRELKAGLKEIWKADVAVKSSKLPRDIILHNLVHQLSS